MKQTIWGLLLACCAALAIAVLWPGRSGDFIFDDLPNIADNAQLHLSTLSMEGLRQASFSYEPGHGSRPLAMLSFALDYWRAGGLHAEVFRDTNLIIHGLTVLALAAFLRRLLRTAQWSQPRADSMALGLALVWAVHPLQVSSVLYVVQRMQTLGTLFLVLGLWAYLAARQAQQAGRSGLKPWCLFGLSGLLGLACKEDVALLPGFTLVLELTVLRFQAASLRQAAWLRKAYLAFLLLGAAVYLLLVVPHYWRSEPYLARNFSSVERLLTQARVLVMYIGQMVLPRPADLPFFYDNLAPSRGLLSPPTTLASLLALGALLIWAWRWRRGHPVFAAGVLFFFVGHFITSNVLNLELAFEHRNHFPLIGILLAMGELVCMLIDRYKLERGITALVGVAFVATLCALTVIRASIWGSPLQFALQGPDWAPDSARAWRLLCKNYYARSGGDPEHPFFSLAVQSCQRAADLPDSLIPLADLITLKTVQKQDVSADWAVLQERVQRVVISPEGRDIMWVMISNANKGVPLDSSQMVRAIASFSARMNPVPLEYATFGDYLLYKSDEPEQAFDYYQKAVKAAGPGDPLVKQILRDLTDHGMEEWAVRLAKEQKG